MPFGAQMALRGSILEVSWSQILRREVERRVDTGGSFVLRKHQKQHCVLDIGASVEDRGHLLVEAHSCKKASKVALSPRHWRQCRGDRATFDAFLHE